VKKKLLRWLIYIFSAVILLFLAAVFFLDTIAKSIAEKRVRAETGMETTIGNFIVGIREPKIHIQNFVLKNPARFGGDTFIEMPELYLEYDRNALSTGKLHLKLVRINISKVHIVENKDGKKNVDDLQKHQPKMKSQTMPVRSSNKTEPAFLFDGIDTLDVTLNSIRFTSEKHPEQNLEQNLGIKHEMFKNLKTDLDFQTAEAVLILKAGMSGALDLNSLFKTSGTGRKSKKVLEDVAEPLKLEPAKP
jgi:uncharacterized protein involved in outer membrane biogenesis